MGLGTFVQEGRVPQQRFGLLFTRVRCAMYRIIATHRCGTLVAVPGIEPSRGHDAHEPSGYYRQGVHPFVRRSSNAQRLDTGPRYGVLKDLGYRGGFASSAIPCFLIYL